MIIKRLGHGSVGKMFAVQAKGPELDAQNLHKRARCGPHLESLPEDEEEASESQGIAGYPA